MVVYQSLWSKNLSPPTPEKTTASSLPRSRLRKKTAELLRTRHAPTPPKRVDIPPCSAETKRSSRLAVIVAQESAEPLVTFDCGTLAAKNYCSFSSFLFFEHTVKGQSPKNKDKHGFYYYPLRKANAGSVPFSTTNTQSPNSYQLGFFLPVSPVKMSLASRALSTEGRRGFW